MYYSLLSFFRSNSCPLIIVICSIRLTTSWYIKNLYKLLSRARTILKSDVGLSARTHEEHGSVTSPIIPAHFSYLLEKLKDRVSLRDSSLKLMNRQIDDVKEKFLRLIEFQVIFWG